MTDGDITVNAEHAKQPTCSVKCVDSWPKLDENDETKNQFAYGSQ